MTCNINTQSTLHTRALTNMGSLLNASHHTEAVRERLATLSTREIEVCLLHLVDGRSQVLIARWIGLTRETVSACLASAVAKVPELAPLRRSAQLKPPRPRILHLSQLPSGDRIRGPFNIDQL